MKKLTQTLLVTSVLAVGATAAGAAFAGHGKGHDCSHEKGQDCKHGKHKHGKNGKHEHGKSGKHDGMGHGNFDAEHRLDRMTKKLDLSEEQREQVKAIFDANQTDRQALGESMQQNREPLRNLIASDDASEADIRAMAETQGQQKADMIVMKAESRRSIEALLTDEQKAKMQSMREKHHHGKS